MEKTSFESYGKAAFGTGATVQGILDKIQGHSVVGLRVYELLHGRARGRRPGSRAGRHAVKSGGALNCGRASRGMPGPGRGLSRCALRKAGLSQKAPRPARGKSSVHWRAAVSRNIMNSLWWRGIDRAGGPAFNVGTPHIIWAAPVLLAALARTSGRGLARGGRTVRFSTDHLGGRKANLPPSRKPRGPVTVRPKAGHRWQPEFVRAFGNIPDLLGANDARLVVMHLIRLRRRHGALVSCPRNGGRPGPDRVGETWHLERQRRGLVSCTWLVPRPWSTRPDHWGEGTSYKAVRLELFP